MNKEAQNRAIREAVLGADKSVVCRPGLLSEMMKMEGLENYPEDLNAMHAAEASLSAEDQEEFVRQLAGIVSANDLWWCLIHATAGQRAEAFLKTIGKWVEE